MSAAASSLRLAARRCQCSFTARQSPLQTSIARSFTTSATHLDDSTPTKPTAPKKTKATSSAPLSPEDAEWARFEETIESMQHGKLAGATARIISSHMTDAQRRRRPAMTPPQKRKTGLMSMGEAPQDSIDDPEFEEDDITSLGHAQLDQHREFRHYARLIAWEMPLLTEMAKPFVPPDQNQILRFRYTTYMGEEHPAENKVVVEFCPDDIPDLSPVQKDKLKKLAGVRYNPETQIVKMSSEMFQSQAQNKRYLGDLVDSLVREAKDPTDTFEDVPLDTRHHTFKVKPKFPREWRMTPERQAQLDAERAESLRLDQAKVDMGQLIDGGAFVREAHEQAAKMAGSARLEEPVMASMGKGPKKLSIRR